MSENKNAICRIISLIQEKGNAIEYLCFDAYKPKGYSWDKRVVFSMPIDLFSSVDDLMGMSQVMLQAVGIRIYRDYVIGLNSEIGENKQLLMLDFDYAGERGVREALAGRSGWLFKTARGFIFWERRFYQGLSGQKQCV